MRLKYDSGPPEQASFLIVLGAVRFSPLNGNLLDAADRDAWVPRTGSPDASHMLAEPSLVTFWCCCPRQLS